MTITNETLLNLLAPAKPSALADSLEQQELKRRFRRLDEQEQQLKSALDRIRNQKQEIARQMLTIERK